MSMKDIVDDPSSPLVTRAAELAALLPDASRNEWREFTWMASGVCHDGVSGRTLRFGDDPRGGITMRCMKACKPLYRTVEETLGIRIQWRKPNGYLRHRQEGVPRRLWKPVPAKPKDPLPATCVGRRLALDDLKDLNAWILTRHKRPLGGFWFQYEGKLRQAGWRQSLSDSEGGMTTAQDGGLLVDGRLVLPWYPRNDLERAASRWSGDLRPALCNGGDADRPCPHDVGVVDFDLKPQLDSTGVGRRWRAAVWRSLTSLGCPTFASSSGDGFHALLRVPAYEYEAYEPKFGQTTLGGLPAKTAHVDTFPPGARHSVVLRLDRRLGGSDVVPFVRLEDLKSALFGRKAQMGRSETAGG